jgi:hypothetical protein
LDVLFSITTESEYLSVNPKHLSDTDLLIQDKFGRVTIKTINMHYRRLIISLVRQNEARKTGEQMIGSFSEEFIGWQDPSKLKKIAHVLAKGEASCHHAVQ